MASERGWITVTTDCPADGCTATNDINVTGGNGDIITKNVSCAECEVDYAAEITITFTAASTEYIYN